MKRIPAFLLCTAVLTGIAFATPAGAQDAPPIQSPNEITQQPPAAQAQQKASDASGAQQAPAAQAQQKAPAASAAPAGAQQEPAAPVPKKNTYYDYANDESEYSIKMPQAPTVKTIWATSPETKLYLDDNLPKKTSFIGEVGLYALTDMDTEASFTAKTIFLKAPDSFLATLDSAKIQAILLKSYAHKVFISPKYHYSVNKSGILKWATLSGFTVDENHQPLFTATHYLTGLHSIFVVRITFSVTNPLYNRYYNDMVGSITYSPP